MTHSVDVKGRVEVWREAPGEWLWAYREPENVELTGNRSFPDLQSALDSARLAYRGVTIVAEGRVVSDEARVHKSSFGWTLVAVAVGWWLRRRAER